MRQRTVIPNHSGEKPENHIYPVEHGQLSPEELEYYRQLKPPKKPSGLSLIEIRPGSSEMTQRGIERKKKRKVMK